MKIITAAVAMAGCVAAYPVCAEQPDGDAMRRPSLVSGNDASGEDGVLPGLLGSYPANREASGTSWQPDSTPEENGRGVSDRSSRAEVFFDYRNDRFSLPRNNVVQTTRGALGPGTIGLQSIVSMDSYVGSAARAESYQRDLDFRRGSNIDSARLVGLAASYSLPVNSSSSVFGYVGVPGEPALGPPVSYMRRLSGVDGTDVAGASHWLDSTGSGARVFTVGYAWRKLKLEGSAFSGRIQDVRRQPERETLRLDSSSTRLSYNPSPNWSFQFSRGTLSGLDQLEPDEEVRRVTISATYNRALAAGNWQSTLAWGRNARKSHEPTMGYLLESTLRFSGAHAVFSRLEQVGSSELVRENESAQSQSFKLNRLTLGYFHEMGAHGPIKLDAGAFVSRYYVPSSASTAYGSEPTSFMLFVRLNLR